MLFEIFVFVFVSLKVISKQIWRINGPKLNRKLKLSKTNTLQFGLRCTGVVCTNFPLNIEDLGAAECGFLPGPEQK